MTWIYLQSKDFQNCFTFNNTKPVFDTTVVESQMCCELLYYFCHILNTNHNIVIY